MIINQSMPDEQWKQQVEENPTNPWKGVLQKLARFTGIKNSERITLFRGEQQTKIEKLYGKAIEDQEQFILWLEGLKALNAGGAVVVLKEGQIKHIKGLADHYKEPFTSRAKKVVEAAMDAQVGNF